MASFAPWTFDSQGEMKDPINLVSNTADSSGIGSALVRAGWRSTLFGGTQYLYLGSLGRLIQTAQRDRLIPPSLSSLRMDRVHVRLWDLPAGAQVQSASGELLDCHLVGSAHLENPVTHSVSSFEQAEKFLADQLSAEGGLVAHDEVPLGNFLQSPANNGYATNIG